MIHTHHCACEHERLRYCRTCRAPYCLDCGQEWRSYASPLWYYYPQQYYSGVASSGNLQATGVAESSCAHTES